MYKTVGNLRKVICKIYLPVCRVHVLYIHYMLKQKIKKGDQSDYIQFLLQLKITNIRKIKFHPQ